MHRRLLRSALLLVAVILLGLEIGHGVEAAPRTPSARPRLRTRTIRPMITVRKFLFTSNRDADKQDIYLAAQLTEGLVIQRLTTHPANDNSPSWSPDGQRIVFKSNRDDTYDGDIYTMKVDGTDLQRLTIAGGIDWYPRWSPKGDRIVWERWTGKMDVWVMDADGSNKQNLTPDQPAFDGLADWSPDGEHIVFTSARDGHRQIYRMNADGSNVVRLTNSQTTDGWPAWSPDGTRIAFTRETDDYPDVYVMKSDGTGVTKITNYTCSKVPGCSDGHPRWSASGKTIIFASTRDADWDIYVMDADGSNCKRLTDAPGKDWEPDYLIFR